MHYQIIVGNIGIVYDGDDEKEAQRTYLEYVSQSVQMYGHAGGEDVTMMEDDEPLNEHIGANADTEGEEF